MTRISEKVFTASFLLNLKWTEAQIKSGAAARAVSQALETLTPQESLEVQVYERRGSFL